MANAEVIRVLLVDDDEEDYEITRDLLVRQERVRFTVDWCVRYDEALQRIQQEDHDVYLIDYRLEARTGLELVQEAFASRPSAPVLILTGQADYAIDVEATAIGVTDYLVKHELDAPGLERSIRYAISHQQAITDLSRSEERYALAVRAVNDGIWDWDLITNRIYYSPRWRQILGQSEEALDGSPSAWFGLVHPDDLAPLEAEISDHLAGRTPHLHSEHRMRHADGGWRWVISRGLVSRATDGTPSRMAGSLSDITDRRDAQLRLQHDALHDHLTGLPNRTLFVDRLAHLLKRSQRTPHRGCAVLFLDIDRFKLVNDSLSHAVGDELLVAIAARIAGAVRPGDTVARLGGDEFTVLLEDVIDPTEGSQAADRVLRSLDTVFEIDSRRLFVSASAGIALSTPAMAPSDLMRNADLAMYEAKRRGHGFCVLFDQSMHRRVANRLARETDLRNAIGRSLLRVHYQPIIELASGEIHGLEALARWPAGWTPVPPSEFIPIAEETGLIGAVGMHVIRVALGQLAAWRRQGLTGPDVCMSVNLSGRQLDDPGLAEQVAAAIDRAGLPPELLRLEITESTLMSNIERAQSVFADICGNGVGLHLDDFGTGYASLTALHSFPVDALKIDRSFVSTVADSGEDETEGDLILRSTVALAHSLRLTAIAEGIETPQQLDRLRMLGCDFGQGYLFSRPLPAEDTEAMLTRWRPEAVADLVSAV